MSRSPTLAEARLVCIDGPAGSGKTTLAARWPRWPPALRSCTWTTCTPGGPASSTRSPTSSTAILLPLAEGRRGAYRRFDWHADAFAETHIVEPGPLLVLEGVGSGTSAHAALRTVLVWVEAPRDLRVDRGVERGGETVRGRWGAWEVAEQRVFDRERTRSHADVRVDGTGEVEPVVIA